MQIVVEVGPNLKDVLWGVAGLPFAVAGACLFYRFVGLLVGVIAE